MSATMSARGPRPHDPAPRHLSFFQSLYRSCMMVKLLLVQRPRFLQCSCGIKNSNTSYSFSLSLRLPSLLIFASGTSCFWSLLSFKRPFVATIRCHWGNMGFPIHMSEIIIRTKRKQIFSDMYFFCPPFAPAFSFYVLVCCYTDTF